MRSIVQMSILVHIVGVHLGWKAMDANILSAMPWLTAHSALLPDVPSLDYVVTGEIDYCSFYGGPHGWREVSPSSRWGFLTCIYRPRATTLG